MFTVHRTEETIRITEGMSDQAVFAAPLDSLLLYSYSPSIPVAAKRLRDFPDDASLLVALDGSRYGWRAKSKTDE